MKESENNTFEKILFRYAQRQGDLKLEKIETGFKNIVYKGKDKIYKIYLEEYNTPKEVLVLNYIHNNIKDDFKGYVPKILNIKIVENYGTILTQNLIPGSNVKNFSQYIIKNLILFLNELHKITDRKIITEFDYTEEVTFMEYVLSAPIKFLKHLEPNLKSNEKKFIEKTILEIKKLSKSIPKDFKYVLLHKDIHGNNLLVKKNKLTGVVDWECALTGPREWEFAILRQRLSSWWEEILKYIDEGLDNDLLDLCGLVQSLRFWKAFPKDLKFIKQQKEYIIKIINKEF